MIRLAVSGVDEEILTQVRPRLKGAEAAVWRDDAALPDCDATVFCGGSETRAPRIEQALQAAKHVLLCGDCTLTPQSLASLSAAARAVNSQFSVVNPDRFRTSRLLVHQELTSGKLGVPGLVRIHRWESQATDDGRQSVVPAPAPLLRDLDVMCWLLERSPSLIFATGTVAESPTNSGRCIQVHLGYSGSAMGMLTYANGLPASESYELLHVIGSAGAAYVDDQTNRQLLYSRGGSTKTLQAPESVRQTASLLQDFVDGLVSSRDFSPTVTNWQNVLATAEVMNRSLETRQAIPLEGR